MKSFVPKETAATSDDGPELPPPAGSDTQPLTESETASLATEQAADETAPDEQKRQGRNAEVNFHGQKRSNATHVSTTDPEARLYRKGQGKEARLSYLGHTLMENRSGLIVEASVTTVSGYAEREVAIAMIECHRPGRRRLTLGADKSERLS